MIKGGTQTRPVRQALDDAGVTFVVGPQHQVVLGEAGIGSRLGHLVPAVYPGMDVARRALRQGTHLHAQLIVDVEQQLDIPREKAPHGIFHERALAGDTPRATRQFHAFAGFEAGGIHLAARALGVAGKGAQQIGIEPVHTLHVPAERLLEHGRNQVFFAMLGQQHHARGQVTGIDKTGGRCWRGGGRGTETCRHCAEMCPLVRTRLTPSCNDLAGG
jgi:hypothetical protein